MNTNQRRRMFMAAGACIAGAAIPIAAASSAWADGMEISYDGKVLFDTFDTMHPFGSSDVGTAAESGANNDWAIVMGPNADNVVGLANDSYAGDSNDLAWYDGIGTTGAPTDVYGEQGAQIVNATNSAAEVFGGGNASINGIPAVGVFDPVNYSAAVADNGGFAGVENDGLAPSGVSNSFNYAAAYGTVHNTGPVTETLGAGTTPSVANIYDSGSSTAIANFTGTNLDTGNGGAAVDLAQSSYAEATNAGSGANVIGTGTVPVVDSGEFVNNGHLYDIFTSFTYQIDGIPNTEFFGDLLGLGGMTAFDTAWADLLAGGL